MVHHGCGLDNTVPRSLLLIYKRRKRKCLIQPAGHAKALASKESEAVIHKVRCKCFHRQNSKFETPALCFSIGKKKKKKCQHNSCVV